MERVRLKSPRPQKPKMRRHHEVAERLRNIEYLKWQLASRLEDLRELLAEPDIAPAWAEFCAAGGATSAELYRWAQGQAIIREGVTQNKHLRLIASSPPPRVRLRCPAMGTGDDAA